MPSSTKKYRSALIIIQSILEQLVKVGSDEGMVKSQIYKIVGLKTVIGEKYLEQLKSAGYISINEEKWGKERTRQKIVITNRGLRRFQWFMKLSTELDI
ncbi:MAG: winged helix-turn-helix domain-containing protein [Promethearchaeota archaeon]